MKGGGSLPTKRGWRGLVVAVLGLVILSMLVPLVFLLGLHNGFHSSGYATEYQSHSSGVGNFDALDHGNSGTKSEGDQLEHLDNLMRRLGPALSKDVLENFTKEAENGTKSRGAVQVNAEPKSDLPVLPEVLQKSDSGTNNKMVGGAVDVTVYVKDVTGGESGKSCQMEFGSYCLWSVEHKEDMKDLMVKKLKDQLFVARAYYPSIAKLPAHEKLSRELKQNIQDFERIFSETTTDSDLPLQIEKKLQKMEAAISKAKLFTVDCNNVDKKLRQILDLTEDEAHFHMKQSAFLYQLAVQTMPKSHHCLSMRLMVEYFRYPSLDMDSQVEKYVNPELHHYVIFSNNVLAASVVINSTVVHAKESSNQVFHVLTDGQNYFAMKFWFLHNSFKEATIHILNIEDLNLDFHDKKNLLHLSLSEEFRVSFRSINKPDAGQMRTEYISVFGQIHYHLPEIFHNLKKVVVLDDDVVVQQDLSPLWSLDMEGKVNGAVQYCALRLGQLTSYLGGNNFNRSSCIWMSGLNMVDLVQWREQNITEAYQQLLRSGGMRVASKSAGVLLANLLTFKDTVHPLDGLWALSGLGHNYNIDAQAIKNAAVLHYNGNMKPWLELGIPKHKKHWKKFLKQDDQFMGECNVNP
ncbi:PREDICTED: probable galacturonosyltransferase 7 isoform X3 [Nelumbo nucifera]|uniref:Hexosyltransferase n=1 Tax=Nelumbo nucifera TaxID=4432 RepID=A0A1U8BFN4_NELNU|nr:PREDICTED: probable galacturonosyltransferase 7 isoform X3 [Nelumbo nucifera]